MLFNFTLYKDLIIKELKECLKDVEVELVKNKKNNGVETMGIHMRSKELTVSPIIGIEDAKEIYNYDDVERFVTKAMAVYRHADKKNGTGVEVLENWQVIKSIVRPLVINYEKNKNYLGSEMPFVKILDLAVTFVIPSQKVLPEYGEGKIRVNNKMMKSWKVNEQILYQQALKNMETEGYKFNDIESVLFDLWEDAGIPNTSGSPLNVLTCFGSNGGAATLISKKILTEVCSRLNRRVIYILPSSIHELLIVDMKEIEVQGFKNMVTEVNEVFVEDEEILSDNVYVFDSVTGELEIAGVTNDVDENRCVSIGNIV